MSSIVEIVGYILTGGIGTVVIKWILDRIGKKKDKQEEAESCETAKVEAMCTALMFLLYDRICYLGKAYLKAEEIDFNDRSMLIKMHDAYHKLGGNGDLNLLMDEVKELPLTSKGGKIS